MKSMNLEDEDIDVRVDPYAPFIFGTYNRDITEKDVEYIYELSMSDKVSMVYVQCPEEPECLDYSIDISDALDAMNATNIILNPSTNGDGIVIGIAEWGVVDRSYEFFDNIDLTIYNESSSTPKGHTTRVAMCAMSMAPGATYLSVQLSTNYSEAMEWLLDNGVNVINLSASIGSETGNYVSRAAYLDSLVRDDWVTIVMAAGNSGDTTGYVAPTTSYNAITVGNCTIDGVRDATSSYLENFNVDAPNLMAVGVPIWFSECSILDGGTSYSAPFVSGAVAVLMQKKQNLILYPERVKSILIATTQRPTGYTQTGGLDDKIGSGMLDLEKAIQNIDNTVPFGNSSNDQLYLTVSSKSIYLSAGQRVRVAFDSVVNAHATDGTNNPTSCSGTDIVTKYYIYIYNSSGSIVSMSEGDSNTRFLDYVAKNSGNYEIRVKQMSRKATTATDYCAYTYCIISE